MKTNMYNLVFKRAFDMVFSFLLLVFLSPIFLVVAILLFIANNGKVIFFQNRPGLNEVEFKLMKFKTMTDKKDLQGNLLPDRERITSLGRFLRKSSLDELPELINIFKGEMSFVGPRPLLISYLPYYTTTERIRHSVRPGLTGLAQVNGRNNLTWDQKLAYDTEYVLKQSFIFDLTILVKTILVVFQHKNILDQAPEGPLNKIRPKQQ